MGAGNFPLPAPNARRVCVGSRTARDAFDGGTDPRVLWERWEAENERWSELVEKYRLYRPAP